MSAIDELIRLGRIEELPGDYLLDAAAAELVRLQAVVIAAKNYVTTRSPDSSVTKFPAFLAMVDAIKTLERKP